MEQHKQHGKLENLLADLGRKMDQLLEKAKDVKEDPRVAERLDDLNRTKDRLERELHDFVEDDEKWQEVKSRLQSAATELKHAFELTFNKRQEKGEKESSSPKDFPTGP